MCLRTAIVIKTLSCAHPRTIIKHPLNTYSTAFSQMSAVIKCKLSPCKLNENTLLLSQHVFSKSWVITHIVSHSLCSIAEEVKCDCRADEVSLFWLIMMETLTQHTPDPASLLQAFCQAQKTLHLSKKIFTHLVKDSLMSYPRFFPCYCSCWAFGCQAVVNTQYWFFQDPETVSYIQFYSLNVLFILLIWFRFDLLAGKRNKNKMKNNNDNRGTKKTTYNYCKWNWTWDSDCS